MSQLGAIADDFTGATDLATNLASRGFQVIVVPEDSLGRYESDDSAYEAVVVALKTRTAPVERAVADSLRALEYLQGLGCERFYDKYCSTFDSTDEGNIGPILDALSSRLGSTTTVVVPSFPANGRVVERGVLYVNGELLENSSMRHHPLTPMTQSRVADILRPQTQRSIGEIHADADLVSALAESTEAYLVIDAASDARLAAIAQATSDSVLVSGGSGLALGMSPRSASKAAAMTVTRGRQLILSGSASTATRGQVRHALPAVSSHKIDVTELVRDAASALASALAFIDGTDDDTVMVYAVDSLEDLATSTPGVADAVEWLLGELAVAAAGERGFTRILVAGGETSGAVVKTLGIDRLIIGPRIAPGVCWASGTTTAGVTVNLALKSGNFGAEDMFTSAWKAISA